MSDFMALLLKISNKEKTQKKKIPDALSYSICRFYYLFYFFLYESSHMIDLTESVTYLSKSV